MEVMVVKNVNNNYFKTKSITAVIGEESDLRILVDGIQPIKLKPNQKVKSIIKKNSTLYEKLKLKNNISLKKIKELSGSEVKLIKLIKAIKLNPDLIILNDFEKGLSPKSYNAISHFIKQAIINNDIKFIILSRDPLFINKISKKVIIMKNKIIKYQGDLLTAIKQELVNPPEIINFINLANEKDVNLSLTLDYKDLLKDIYRSVT